MASIEIGQPLTARGKATRARIVEAATELVRAHGVANTSLDAVLAASDTSKSQLYHYFADKDDLVLAVIQRQTECVLATHESHLRKLHSLAGLRRWRDAVVELSRQTDCAGGCPLGSLVSELAESPRPRELLAESFARWEALLVAGFRAIQARSGTRRDCDLTELATVVLAALQGGLLLAQTTRSTRALELALDMAIDHVEAHLA
ncbi:TetR/AcrR family transcriptional regulator [Mesorhizobium qingshengii]|uniref:TetR/AcrR family transcriptional regulator n=1 Tax=Mesorhizobium qingshengii TaxID=1165689 RepID=A0ABT4QWJ2_9HYPH|nr:TetR/AcrR family transcriptional regulator [Mesorhizobium qingshengii]MCZ8545869.1 TetR/AcrR family transcriptional regulator [Mesorhizobium qingshengii]